MTRVIHTGDTHIGYQQYHAPERRRDFLAAFRQVVDDAVEANVDAVVHAGDLFHDRRPGLPDLLGTIETLRALRDAGVPFLAVVGNHEDTRDAQWLDLFEQLGLATRLDAEGTVVGDVTVYGLDHVPPSRRDELDYEFAPPDTDHAALVAHGLFTPFAHADWDTEAVLAASNVDFDAVLLGDNHHPDTAEVADTWVTYCGSTERASTDERADRGYNVVTFEEEIRIARRGIETRPFVFLGVDLAPGEGTERVRQRVREADVTDAVVVVTVTGDGDEVVPADVEAAGDEGGALLTRVTDRREREGDPTDVEVSFADPDAAVRERVREMGLSDAARRVEATVRDEDLARSNVREAVERTVADLVEDDLAALDPVPEDADQASGGDGTDQAAGGADDSSGATEGGADAGESDASRNTTMEEFL
ncbi:MAG: DNA double-strand break repair protein Mre11 [Halobacteriaceae archaeon]